ncbi:MAG: tetratricopeptide repeat protein [Betaproteobacteria bacterium]
MKKTRRFSSWPVPRLAPSGPVGAGVPRRIGVRGMAGALMLAAGLMLAGVSGHAAMSDPSPTETPWLASARADLKAERFEQAVGTLRAANAADSAEWHNLLGYALRKKTPPDLTAAETHYKRALEIDPRHRHAMEYYGELFLMKGDLAGAEAMLARLNKACFLGCEELRDLKAAIARYKSQAGKGK